MAERIARTPAVVATPTAHRLGEGPVWDGPRERVLWVDIEAGEIHAGTLHDTTLEGTVIARLENAKTGAVVPAAGGGLLVARTRSVEHIDSTGTRTTIATLIPGTTNSRLNDGATDPAGRFLVGSMALDDRTGEERLWRIEHDGAVTVLDDDLSLSNGLGWSPDGGTMYSIDTTAQTIYTRGYDPETGAHGPRHPAFHVPDGSPDGMCVDAEGLLWVAIWGAGEVRRYTADGELRAVVEAPAPHTSCPAFAGPDLATLIITTARDDLDAGQLERFPLSGHVFAARPGPRGLPTAPWAGRT